MHSRKAVTLLSGAMTLSLALAACGGTSKNDGNKEDPGATGQPTSSASPAGPPVTITFWHAYSADSPEVKTLENVLIPAFEADHPGITVKDVAVPYDQLHQKLLTAAAGGRAAGRRALGHHLGAGARESRRARAARREQMPDFKSTRSQGLRGPARDELLEGPLLRPAARHEHAGLDVQRPAANGRRPASPAPPKTFASSVAMAPKLKGKGIFAYADNGTSGWNMLPWIWSNGGDITNPDVHEGDRLPEQRRRASPASRLLVDLYKRQADAEASSSAANGGLATSDGLAKRQVRDDPRRTVDVPDLRRASTRTSSCRPLGAGRPGRQHQRRRRRGHGDDAVVEEQGRGRAVHALHALA